jgi:hypothetical protein
MALFVPFLLNTGRTVLVAGAKKYIKKNLHKYRGSISGRKMYDKFMDVSEKVAGSKPAQTLAKNLEKVNPNIRKIAPDGAPTPSPMEYGVYKTVVKLLRGKAIKAGGQKIQAIKDGLEQGTMTENAANKALKKINKQQQMLEKSKENPFM